MGSWILYFSIAALIVAFLKELFTEKKGQRKWNQTVVLAFVLLLINAAIELAKHKSDVQHEEISKRQQEQLKSDQKQLRSDMHSLNDAALKTFEKLNRTLETLPAGDAKNLTGDAREIRTRLNALNNAIASGNADRSAVAEMRNSLEEIQAKISDLTANIERGQIQSALKPLSQPQTTAPASPAEDKQMDRTPAIDSRQIQVPSTPDRVPSSNQQFLSDTGLSPGSTVVATTAANKPFTKKGRPEIQITQVPPSDAGGPDHVDVLAGTTAGVDPSSYRVVIYVRTDHWYVQPSTDEPLTKIENGKWTLKTHLGREYAALLVRASYRIPGPVLSQLPRPEGEVVDLDIQPGSDNH